MFDLITGKTPSSILYLLFLVLCCPLVSRAQNHQTRMAVEIVAEDVLKITQEIDYVNQSERALDTVFFYNWPNAYAHRSTPLAKRLEEDYSKAFYFASKKERGYSNIEQAAVLNKSSNTSMVLELVQPKDQEDLFYVLLKESIQPGETRTFRFGYQVKLPSDRFTRYGYGPDQLNLRYWYVSPAVHDKGWVLHSNLNLDDQYLEPTDYTIDFAVPMGYTLHSDLMEEVEIQENQVLYHLSGKGRLDIEVNVQLRNNFSSYQVGSVAIQSNLRSKNLTENIKSDLLQRQMQFIEEVLGAYPHDKMLINRTTYLKQPVYGFNQLPRKMNPFSDVFEWDIKMFKALSGKFIETTLVVDPRKDIWLNDGIQIYLMMTYVDKYYPEVKAIGKISKKWGIRNYSIAKLPFNGKYPFVYQFSTRKNLDQSLKTSADSLSNFNFKLVNRYKSGLGLHYLDSYLNDSLVNQSLQAFYQRSVGRKTNSQYFGQILQAKTDKDLSWYFGDYLKTKKKINYTIKKVERRGDSAKVWVENKSNFTAPYALYGIDKNEVVFKQWHDGTATIDTLIIPTKGIDKVNLNFEQAYPESNLRDNWKKLDPSLLNRPLKFRFYRDIEDPNYNQVFYKPFINYNFYDGLLLGPTIYNQALFKKKWLFSVTPVYGFKSKTITGALGLAYEHLPEKGSVYRYRAGFSTSRFHYAEDLAFNRFVPFFRIDFNRKTLRDVGGQFLLARNVYVDKELPDPSIDTETFKYNVFNLRYGMTQPEIIKDLRYFVDGQYAGNFSKISLDLRYRKLTSLNRYLDLRLFFGTFLHNDTSSDFFSFALDRPSDYLFDLDYLGRSEASGFLSQQLIISEGGFKTIFPDQFANQWMLTSNASISIWRWIELYGDVGLTKNRSEATQFRYDSGIRLNFVHNFLELYFPLQSSLGFEPSFSDYSSRIRFVLTIDPERIYNLVKRGFY